MNTILLGLLVFVFCFSFFALGFDMGTKYEKEVGVGYTPKPNSGEIKPPKGGTGVIGNSTNNDNKH